MVYKHAVVAAFCIYPQRGEFAAKRGGWSLSINSHGNYIVDHGKSWKNHGIVYSNICGNPDLIYLENQKKLPKFVVRILQGLIGAGLC